jgi:carboxymethylenebutenolidase
MERLTAADFEQELLILFDAYVHGDIDRRSFLDRASRFAVGGLSAAGLLAVLSPRFAAAQIVPPDDARVHTERVDVPSPAGHGTVRAYVARPAQGVAQLPGVLVVHENRGLNPHIEDVARRLALEGFVAMAPDSLTPLGGYPGDEDRARALFAQLDQSKTRQDFLAAAAALRQRPDGNGRIGVVGFCYGGGIANELAVRLPETIQAAVPFYGRQPNLDDVPKIRGALLIHYAGLDQRINAGWPAYEQALQAAGVKHTAYTYPEVNHGFHNDSTPRFDEQAAKLAWERTIEFFNSTLR